MSNRRPVVIALLCAVLSGTLTVGQPPAPAPPQTAPAPPAPPAPGQAEFNAGNEAFQKQDWGAAVASYRAALAAGMSHALLHFRLGYALHVTGKPGEALAHHLLAAQITNPALRIDALYNAACAHALLGHTDEALEFLAHAIDAGFVDLKQVSADTDLDSLREDPRFRALVDGIGKAPRLHEQLGFLLGTWTSTNERGEVMQTLTLTRPSDSQGIGTMLTNIGGAQWTGLLAPNHAERTWLWVSVDALGTMLQLTGKATEAGGMAFTGRQATAAGPGVHLRLTYTPGENGTVRERAEVSEDGVAWRTHHEETLVRTAEPGR